MADPEGHQRKNRRTRRSRRSFLRGLLIACALVVAEVPARAAPQVEVIVSPDQANTEISRRLLLSIYIGRITTWPDGTLIRAFSLPDDDPLHVEFCRQLLGTYPYVLRNAWEKLVYTGTGFAPITVSSEREMRKRVADTPGAIGYVAGPPADDASGTDLTRPKPDAGASKP